MPTITRILLVDGSALFRRALATLLNHRRGLRVVGEAASGAEALAQCQEAQPDVVLLDPAINDGGPGLIAELARRQPSCAVVVLCDDSTNEQASAVLQAGARGYLLKSCEPDDLVRTIERVRAGELVVSPAVAGMVFRSTGIQPDRGRDLSTLTDREREVLSLVALGKTNAQIAQELAITEHTVKTHLAKVLGKLRAENRVQLAALAVEHGLVRPDSSATDP